MENVESIENIARNDGFAALDTLATSFAVPAVVLNDIPAVEAPVPAEIPIAKVDKRKGERKTQNPDGSVSYGLKADGSPRKKPGRKAKVNP